jgi:hypothetical protein
MKIHTRALLTMQIAAMISRQGHQSGVKALQQMAAVCQRTALTFSVYSSTLSQQLR